MSGASVNFVMAHTVKAAAITIPDNADTAVTVKSLISSHVPESDDAQYTVIGVKIRKHQDGVATDREAVIYGPSTSALPGYVAAGEEHFPEALAWHEGTYIKGAAGSVDVGAVVDIYLRVSGTP